MKLSPSALGDFKDCACCFWFDKVKGIKKPRGIFPSLPGGIDRIAKVYFDIYRAKGELPAEVAHLGGQLFNDQASLNGWRNWRTGLACLVGDIEFSGAVDDILLTPAGSWEPLDYKTRGAAPKEGDSERYYGHQMASYALLFEMNGHPVTGNAHLVYYWPKTVLGRPMVGNGSGPLPIGFEFDSQVKTIAADPADAIKLINAAAECLKGSQPEANPACEFCEFRETGVAA